MIGWQQDIFKDDYVRLITAEEYVAECGKVPANNPNYLVLKERGGKVYNVEGCKYNGKIIFYEDKVHAYPPLFLRPWHNDSISETDISENDFSSLIGE